MYVVPTYHPAHLLRGHDYYIDLVIADVARAKRIAENGWKPPGRIYTVVPGNETYGSTIVNMLNWWYETGQAVAIDTETTSLDPRASYLRTVGAAAAGGDIAVAWPTNGLSPQLTRELRNALRRICMAAHITKVFHNLGFDIQVLQRHGYPIIGTVLDTIVLHHIRWPDLEHDLETVSTHLLDTDLWKTDFRDMEKHKTDTVEHLLYYNARDALSTASILGPLLTAVQQIDGGTVMHYETAWADLARRMEEVGLPIDVEAAEQLRQELTTKIDEHLYPIRVGMKWPEFNLNRQADKQKLLYEMLKLPVRRYTKKKMEPSTSYKGLIEHLEHPIVKAFIQAYEAQHDLSTFVLGYTKRMVNARLHVSWNPTGQVGSRFSSSPNCQNITKRLRRLIGTTGKRILVGADASQLEARIQAAVAGARWLLSAYAENRDTHSELAADVFGASFTGAPDEKKYLIRLLAKRVYYAWQYDAADDTIYNTIREDRRVPVEVRSILRRAQVSQITRAISRRVPEILHWRDNNVALANSNGYTRIAPLGRTRVWPVIPVERILANNWAIQTAGSDYINCALLKVDERIPNNAKVIHNGHDSMIVECDVSDAEKVKEIMEECMEWQLDGPAGPVRIFGEAKIGRSMDLLA